MKSNLNKINSDQLKRRTWPKFLLNLFYFGLILLCTQAAFAQIGSVVHSFSTPADRPTGLTWDGQHLWLADIGTNLIYKLNPDEGAVISTISAPANATINGLAWDGQHLWCSDNGDTNKIYQLDPIDGRKLRSFALISGSPRGLVFDGENLWYQDSGSNFIYQIDTLNGQLINSFRAPSGGNRGLAWDGRYLWSSDKDADELYLVDSMHQSVIRILNAPGSYPYGLAFDGAYLWNVDYETDRMYKIQLRAPDIYKLNDSLQVDIHFSNTVTNVGTSKMDLYSYLSCPVNLLYQHLDDSLDYKPEPNYFHTDKYKQKMAVYHDQLDPNQSKTYQYSVPVTLQSIRYFLDPDSMGDMSEIPADIISLYTRDDDKYELSDPTIIAAAQEALAGETNLYWQVRNIHDYVLAHMVYERVGGWDPAPVILARETGSCSEYTFLFIALCREAGIPARYEAGGHLRDNLPYDDTVFHRWAQVYFPRIGWVPIDADADDKEFPANQARHFGGRENDLFSTTLSGGGEPGMSWSYNVYNSSSGGDRQRENLMQWLPYLSEIAIEPGAFPLEYLTVVNYPNPFNNATRIVYNISKAAPVFISIYNTLGQRIRFVDQGYVQQSGSYIWDGKSDNGQDLSSGVYFYQINVGEQQASGKMQLIK